MKQKMKRKSIAAIPTEKESFLQTRKLERTERDATRCSYKVMPPSFIKSNDKSKKNMTLRQDTQMNEAY